MTVWSTVRSSLSYSFRSASPHHTGIMRASGYFWAHGFEPMRISVRVVPNAKRFRLQEEGSGLKVHLREKAEGNKANLALIKHLGKLLKTEVRLVSGAKARSKVLEVAGEVEEIRKAIRAACEKEGA